jgi:DNA mismatch endonuclease (patch repair protein)
MTEDPAQRSATMRAVRGADTGPELKVRRLLRAIAPGYRLHRKDVPGRPDVAYVGARKAVFVHGCFWHGHDCPRGARAPRANADYWRAKIARNRARDARVAGELAAQGWDALTVWECELKDEAAVAERLRRFLQEERRADRQKPRPPTAKE